MTSDDQFDEIGEITDKCHFATPICDQLSNEVPTLVQDEIQSILVDIPSFKPLVFPAIVYRAHVQPVDADLASIQKEVQSIPMEISVIPQIHDSEIVTWGMTDEYCEVFPLAPSQRTDYLYYKTIPMLNAFKMIGLYHNLIVDGSNIWLCSSIFPRLLIISFYKTRGRFFSNKNGLM